MDVYHYLLTRNGCCVLPLMEWYLLDWSLLWYINKYFMMGSLPDMFQDRCVTITPHHYQCGGCQHACFSADGQRVITVGDDRNITCWEWRYVSNSIATVSVNDQYAHTVLAHMVSRKGSSQPNLLKRSCQHWLLQSRNKMKLLPLIQQWILHIKLSGTNKKLYDQDSTD